jgi:hypothetical protein
LLSESRVFVIFLTVWPNGSWGETEFWVVVIGWFALRFHCREGGNLSEICGKKKIPAFAGMMIYVYLKARRVKKIRRPN